MIRISGCRSLQPPLYTVSLDGRGSWPSLATLAGAVPELVETAIPGELGLGMTSPLITAVTGAPVDRWNVGWRLGCVLSW